jgi:hypothetical protein
MTSIIRALLAALAVAAASPISAAKPEKQEESPVAKAADAFDMSKLMAVVDKIFPAQPEPQPQRLALARATAAGVLPNGTYASMFDEFAGGMIDRLLSLSDQDFPVKGGKPKTESSTTLRQELAKDDPYFEERMRIIRRVVNEELIKVSAVVEPKLRDGLARSIARRLDEKQLTEINAFLATDSGKAFAAQTMRMWVDPDVMRSWIQSVPDLIAAMPGAMARLEKETAHLPKPKKKTEEEPAEEDPTA